MTTATSKAASSQKKIRPALKRWPIVLPFLQMEHTEKTRMEIPSLATTAIVATQSVLAN
jgi:hypothetical protein